MGEIGADAIIVGAGPSLRYFTGVGWNATERLVAMILPRAGRARMICPRFELGSLEASLGIEAPIGLWEEHESPYALAAGVLADLGAKRSPSTPPCRSSPSTAYASPRRRRDAQRRAGHRRLPDDQVAGRARPDEPGQGHDAGGPPPRRAHPQRRDHHHRGPPLHRPGAPRAGRRRRLVLLRGAVRRRRGLSARPARRAEAGAGRHRPHRHRLQGPGLQLRHHPHLRLRRADAEQRRVWEVEKRPRPPPSPP